MKRQTPLVAATGVVLVAVCSWRLLCVPGQPDPEPPTPAPVAAPAEKTRAAVERLKARLRHPESFQLLHAHQLQQSPDGRPVVVELHFTAKAAGVVHQPRPLADDARDHLVTVEIDLRIGAAYPR